MCADRRSRCQHGLSLIELIMFIVIVSVGVVGILSVMNLTTRHSADPMIQKQALAIAESLLEEIELQPFTFCDPEDANAATATVASVGANGCAATVQGVTPTSGQKRSVEPRFNNVGDYGGFSMNAPTPGGIKSLEDGTVIGGLEQYNATVALTSEATGGVAAADVLRIDVRVTGPGNADITLTGYRFRYAPRAVP